MQTCWTFWEKLRRVPQQPEFNSVRQTVILSSGLPIFASMHRTLEES